MMTVWRMNQRISRLPLVQTMIVFPLVPTVQLSAYLMMTVSVYCVVVLLIFLGLHTFNPFSDIAGYIQHENFIL